MHGTERVKSSEVIWIKGIFEKTVLTRKTDFAFNISDINKACILQIFLILTFYAIFEK